MSRKEAIQYLTDTGISPEHIIELIEALRNYTDAEIQKMQDLEFAEIQKAYEIGKDDGSIGADVLDKIRAEIDSYCSDNRDRNDGLYIAMRIIDKYKASPTGVEELRRILLERDDEMISFRQLVNRFDSVEKEYPNQPWNLKQIYNNFNILIGEKSNNWNWISVLDKLPEKEGLYIVTREYSWGGAIVDTSYWFKSKTNNHGFDISDRVVAWMSVEPYKQEVEE